MVATYSTLTYIMCVRHRPPHLPLQFYHLRPTVTTPTFPSSPAHIYHHHIIYTVGSFNSTHHTLLLLSSSVSRFT